MFTELLTRTLILAEVLEIGAAQEVLDQKVKILMYRNEEKSIQCPFLAGHFSKKNHPQPETFFPGRKYDVLDGEVEPGSGRLERAPVAPLELPRAPRGPVAPLEVGVLQAEPHVVELGPLVCVCFPGFDHREFDVCRAQRLISVLFMCGLSRSNLRRMTF